MNGAAAVEVVRWRDTGCATCEDQVAVEAPVALTYNRRAHVVMMATPADLEDFGLGFSLTEGVIDHPEDLLSTRILPRTQGIELAMTVTEPCARRLDGQRRNLTGRTGCGLCGAESLEQALHAPSPVAQAVEVTHAALQRAIDGLQGPQPLQQRTGAVHCAAWCGAGGEIEVAREDVGRHNALDKLIGRLAAQGIDPASGFIAVSSRASYEMAYKASAFGAEVLLAVSAPTALAIEFARASGMTLVGFARPGRHNVYTFPERIKNETGDQRDDRHGT